MDNIFFLLFQIRWHGPNNYSDAEAKAFFNFGVTTLFGVCLSFSVGISFLAHRTDSGRTKSQSEFIARPWRVGLDNTGHFLK